MSPKCLFASDHEDDDENELEYDASSTMKKCSFSSKISKPQSPSHGDSEHKTDSESESCNTYGSPSASDFTIKPIVSKPTSMEDSSKPKMKNKAHPTAEPEHEQSVKDSKKRKVSDDVDAKKGSGLNRLWNQDDEIAILNGMIEYRFKKGSDPNADYNAFYEFVKNTIQANVSKNQLMEKIRRLKKKYKINAQKTLDGDHVFPNPHEKIIFDLGKKIWETSVYDNDDGIKCNGTLRQSNGGDKDEAEDVVEKKNDENGEMEKNQTEEFWSNHPSLNESLRLMKCVPGSEWIVNATKRILPLIEKSRVKELEDRWSKLHLEEIALYLHKIELIQEQGLRFKRQSKALQSLEMNHVFRCSSC
ncbi:STOREKEEPER protein isoform X2 [Ziziphus jujuba]|uniref:STOREKEEPER protein isoform X2 n=1 Tax=Ziziphus jujuba TaxID=326968 RepID=A0A6P6FSM9_ZIZJJ|nr:STOREKEEPER protein isoform X2 [Ziziphus jujuba]